MGILKVKREIIKGFSAKILQTMLNNVILMLTYEKIQLLVRYALLKVIFRVKK